MFERLMSLINRQSATRTLPANDVPHAVGALLVRAAKADEVYLFEEIEQIDELLAHRYQLTADEATFLRRECEELDAAISDKEEFAGVLREVISMEEREATILSLWEVVFADGYEAVEEDYMLLQMETYLGVPYARSQELRRLVKAAS